MRLLIKDRASGKTTGLIYTSETTGYPIVTLNERMAGYIEGMAREMGCIIPDPISLGDFIGNLSRGKRKPDHVLFDEVESVLGDALNAHLGTDVVAATMTDSLKELDERRKKTYAKV